MSFFKIFFLEKGWSLSFGSEIVCVQLGSPSPLQLDCRGMEGQQPQGGKRLMVYSMTSPWALQGRAGPMTFILSLGNSGDLSKSRHNGASRTGLSNLI